MNDDSIFQKVSLPSCPHSTEQTKRVYLSYNQQHKHIQSLNSKVYHSLHFKLFHHSVPYFISIRLHFHADKFYSTYFPICFFYYLKLLNHDCD